jgi:hypothetical protein
MLDQVVTTHGVWIGNWIYWILVITGNYNSVTNVHILQITTTDVKASVSSPGIAR